MTGTPMRVNTPLDYKILQNNETKCKDGISELLRIFTLINAQLAAQAKWCPMQLENMFDNVFVYSHLP